MSDVVHVKKTHIFWVSVLTVAFIASLVYAYVFSKKVRGEITVGITTQPSRKLF